MQNPTSGITNSSYKQVIEKALAGGWEFVRYTGGTHGMMQWPPTGERVIYGFTVSPTAFKSKAAEIEKISGVVCWKAPKRGRSRKKDQTTDYSLEQARKEHNVWERKWGERVERLQTEHAELREQFAELIAAGENRTVIDQARKVLHRVMEVEKGLDNFHQQYQKFDPFEIRQNNEEMQ